MFEILFAVFVVLGIAFVGWLIFTCVILPKLPNSAPIWQSIIKSGIKKRTQTPDA
jgi:hypothetical protein